ncbi:hypothetical protein LF599_00205 [Pseudodesulfovibrio thermohalotolerans]|jgi:hypothetical protein|uniref:hypothetical protein n=1 Tax=Pseudodesulfovibrio thermohalotolerans TaxID=2880651 RepID=UPI0022B9D609|nr:hypothetical protein [Pseudodesulfovibrio thermohalotolerans]WFS62614.1 hypothetical protein LF599_00205 [Pseudodesulfovibrio thermohalotolerans]
MSMDNDTRLAMMHMRNEAHRYDDIRPRRNNSKRVRKITSAMAAFTLLLFTRGF